MGIYEISLATVVGINIILALGLNLITGFCGQISLGHAAFYGIGAYCAALLAKAGAPLPAALLAGMAAAGSIGVIVGLTSLRVREDFLAIYHHGRRFSFSGDRSPASGTRRGTGHIGHPVPRDGKGRFSGAGVSWSCSVTAWNLLIKKSWMGFAFDAVADDEDTARILERGRGGIQTGRLCHGNGAGRPGRWTLRLFRPLYRTGRFRVHHLHQRAVHGGRGGYRVGVRRADGDCHADLMPEFFRFVSDYKLLLYGALLFGVMRFAPGGLADIDPSYICAHRPPEDRPHDRAA